MKKTVALGIVTAATAVAVILGTYAGADQPSPPSPVDGSSMIESPSPESSTPADDYDLTLEDPVIEGDPPQTYEDFHRDSQEGIIDEFGPMPDSPIVMPSGEMGSEGE
ncbi:hypothetical protein [Rhodococcus wratislaviensis]|uniref:hypothetical protein n=1 Tax=Rhodococcus wratislaviensis TaxID=44752 RepID=UPI00365E4A66